MKDHTKLLVFALVCLLARSNHGGIHAQTADPVTIVAESAASADNNAADDLSPPPPFFSLLRTNALNYDANQEMDDDLFEGLCVDGPPEGGSLLAPDAQTTSTDEVCQALGNCHISSTAAGEMVVYNVFPTDYDLTSYHLSMAPSDVSNMTTHQVLVQVTLRVAAAEASTKALDVQLYRLEDNNNVQQDIVGDVDTTTIPPITATVQGTGFQSFYDLIVGPFRIDATLDYQVVVDFVDGHVNLCSVEVMVVSPVVAAVEELVIPPGTTVNAIDDDNDTSQVVADESVESTQVETGNKEPKDELGPHTVPFAVSALQYDDSNESDEIVLPEGTCGQEGQASTGNLPDVQGTLNDVQCLAMGACHVTSTTPGEWLEYDFTVDLPATTATTTATADDGQQQVIDVAVGLNNTVVETMIPVDVTVRVASDAPLVFELNFMDGPTMSQGKRFKTMGRGSQVFEDVTWNGVMLVTNKALQTLRISWLEAGINVCSVSVMYSTVVPQVSIPVPPITWPAIDYYDALDLTQPYDEGDKCSSRLDGVDTILIDDDVCVQRDNSFCAVAFTLAGEFLEYRFDVPPRDSTTTGMYDVRIRASALVVDDTMIRLELWSRVDRGSPYEKTVVVPSSEEDSQSYHDLVWTPGHPLIPGEYILTVSFSGKNINLCSVAVLESMVEPPESTAPPVLDVEPEVTESPEAELPLIAPPEGVEPKLEEPMPANTTGVTAPGVFSALTYVDFNDTTAVNEGDCPRDAAVDTQRIQADFACARALLPGAIQRQEIPSVACSISNTERGEHLLYRFQTDGVQTSVNLSFRLSSVSSSRRIQVQLYPDQDGPTQIFVGAGLGYHNFTNVQWDNVSLNGQAWHDMKVTFIDGRVNLCAFGVEYS